MVLMGWLIDGENIWIIMGGKLTMMFWDIVIAGPIMGFWIIVREVSIPLLTLSIFVWTILIVLVILDCTFYVTNFFNNIVYF